MEGDFKLDQWLIQPKLNIVIGSDNTPIPLAPEVMKVLFYLADRAGNVVSREALLQDIWGNSCAGENSLPRCIAELKRIFHDDEGKPHLIETDAPTGYRLDLPGSQSKDPASRYQVGEKIGEGGMGIVYRGQDTHLVREVAIKVLTHGVLNDESARRRFRKEAHALSKLSHQNIGAIYDFASQDNVDLLVMEYIPGRTLREVIAAGALSEKEILRLGTQMAEGLAAAHAHGIVHCDLKPGNIMVTPDGRVKILDFGLARLVPSQSQDVSTISSIQPRFAGTLPYMSPEQLTGGTIDSRSDIYAVGNVLYEMATGRLPFQGTLSTALVNEIVHNPPPPPGRFRTDLSSRMEELILKCLEKDPEYRYQSAKELLVDLRRSSSQDIPVLLSAKRRGSRWPVWSIVALSITAGLAVFALLRFWPSSLVHQSLPRFDSSQVTSTASWEGQPAVSPNGEWIAYSAYYAGDQHIFLTDIRGSAPFQLTNGRADDEDPTWYPDGSAIAFVSDRGGRTAIWKVGLLGSGATLLLENAIQPAISPDQKRIAFARASATGTYGLGVASLSNPSDVKMLIDGGNGTVEASNPAWSPDSNAICYVDHRELWSLAASGGSARRLTSDGEDKSEPVWSPDGSHIYFSSFQGGSQALWRIPAGGGKPERLTQGTGPEGHPSISKDGRLLVHAADNIQRQLVLRNRDSGAEKVLPGFEYYMPAIAPDAGKIVFLQTRSSSDRNLWVQNLAHGNPTGSPYRLTELDGVASHPAFSSDGQWIAYYRILLNKRDIWLIPESGGPATPFTDDSMSNTTPAWSHDGTMIAFASQRSGSSQIWVAPVKNGKPAGTARQLTRGEFTAFAPAWSPDGAKVAFQGIKKEQSEVWVVSSDGNTPAAQLTKGANIKRLRWDWHTGDLLVSGSWEDGKVILRRVSPKTGDSTPFHPTVEFGDKRSFGFFDITPDGKWLVFSRENASGHIWLLKATSGFF